MGIHLTNTGNSSIMAMKCNRFVTNNLIFSYRSVLTSVGERINNEEKKERYVKRKDTKKDKCFFVSFAVEKR